MPNLSQVLKQEIARIARKELRSELQTLKSAASKYRGEIAALKRQVAALTHRLTESARLARMSTRIASAAANGDDTTKVRFSGKNLVALRRRLGLSRRTLGILLGVSEVTIYNWETKSGRPKQEHMVRIVAARALTKKQALAIVAGATAAA